MSVNGRAKGRAFEQSIARDLRASLGEGWVVMRNQTDRQRGATGSAVVIFRSDAREQG